MGKISDLWVRLGLKKEGFDKGMDDAGKKANGFGASLGKMKAGALAVWAAIGAAVTAFAKDFVGSTNRIGDAWEQTMGGIKSAWQTVKASLANWDFKNFGQNVADAFRGGKEGVAAADEVYEITNKLNIARAKMQSTLNDLYFAMSDPGKTLEERIAAGRRYLSLQQGLYNEEIAMMKRQKDAAIKTWLAGSGVSASVADVESFFSGYTGRDSDAVSQMYPELRNIYENMRSDKTNQPVVDAILAYERALSASSEDNKRIIRQLNTLTSQDIALDQVEDAHKMAVQLGQQMGNDIRLLNQEFEEIGDIELDLSDVDAEINAFLDDWRYGVEQVAMLNGMLEDSIVQSMGNGLQAITDMMMGLEGADMKNVLAAFIAPFGDTMKQMGAMIMAEGVAMAAFKESFENPFPAIAAGAALMAIGSLVSSGLQKLTANPMGGGSSAYYTGGATGMTADSYDTELTIYVRGKLDGGDLVLSGQRTRNEWGR